jgi:hypothetical protein
MSDIPLGILVKDRVTGFVGVTENRASFMYGCDRYCVQPLVDKDGKVPVSIMVDEPQLEIVEGEKQIMKPLAEPPELVEMGQLIKDPVRGMEGTVTGRAVYLNGCSRLCISPKQIGDKEPKSWWVDEQQVVGKKTLLGKDNIPVQPDTKRSTGGPAPHDSKY